MRAVKLRTEHVTNPMGIDVRRPVLSWVCEGGIRQSAYQIMAEVSMVDGRKEFWDSGKVFSQSMQVRLPKEAESRRRIVWKVLLWDEKDETEGWSDEAFFETALLDAAEWKARWINPEDPVLEEAYQPAS